MPRILLLLLAVPVVELVVIVAVARSIGVGLTLLLLAVTCLLGAWLVKVAGLGVFRRFLSTTSQGKVPHREIVDGAILSVAGVLMLVPGFVSAVVGLVLLAPPTRALLRDRIVDRITGGLLSSPVVARFERGQVWDTSATEVRSDRPPGPPGLSP